MPSGKVHDRITAVGAALSAPIWWVASVEPHDWTVGATLVGSILFSGWMLSPDLDLDSAIYRRWGPLRFLWWPYQRLVPHRSWVSHSWLLGPLIRVTYFLVVLWLLAHALLWGLRLFTDLGPHSPIRDPIWLVTDLYRRYPDQTTFGVIGLLVGAALHTGADTLVTGIKKQF